MRPSHARPGWAVLAAILIALLVKSFVLDAAVVEGRSMLPGLKPGTVLLVLRCAYGLRSPVGGGYLFRWADPRPGEIVAAANPRDGKAVVKRVAIAGPATLRVESDRLIGPGLDLDLPREAAERFGNGIFLPRGTLFILGDNPPESLDSRNYGPVAVESLRGRVLFCPRWAKQ